MRFAPCRLARFAVVFGLFFFFSLSGCSGTCSLAQVDNGCPDQKGGHTCSTARVGRSNGCHVTALAPVGVGGTYHVGDKQEWARFLSPHQVNPMSAVARQEDTQDGQEDDASHEPFV